MYWNRRQYMSNQGEALSTREQGGFPGGSLDRRRSRSGRSAEVGTLRTERGNPKYRMGKSAIGQARVASMSAVADGGHWMAVAVQLAKFMRGPDAVPKMSRMTRTMDISMGS